MSAPGHLARSAPDGSDPPGAARRCRGAGTDGFAALAGGDVADERGLEALLARDGRDTDDIPGFAVLAERQAEFGGLIASTPARGFAGLLTETNAVRLRTLQVGYDAAAALRWSLAGGVSLFDDSFLVLVTY